MLSLTRSSRFPTFRSARSFTSSSRFFDRAVVYSSHGNPSSVLRVITYPNIPPPQPNSVNIRFLLAPINPADINVIEGVYPTKPSVTDAIVLDDSPAFVGGNEGVACITAVGKEVNHLQVGDVVIMAKQQAGTWATSRNVSSTDVIKLPSASSLTDVQAATLTVNPPTALNMIKDFVPLEPGDWVIQNGANSAVGRAVIEIAAAKGLNTLNLIRDRPNIEDAKEELLRLGATRVLTYAELEDKSMRKQVKEWTNGKDIRLGLNCVGGSEATLVARYLGQNAHFVSYGAMSKKPISLPTSLFIFKNLTCHGFWQSRWYLEKSEEQRLAMMQELVGLIKEKQLSNPSHEIITLPGSISDNEATSQIRTIVERLQEGKSGKKVLLKVE